jgi:hypothetical protein
MDSRPLEFCYRSLRTFKSSIIRVFEIPTSKSWIVMIHLPPWEDLTPTISRFSTFPEAMAWVTTWEERLMTFDYVRESEGSRIFGSVDLKILDEIPPRHPVRKPSPAD